jgi:cytochrome c-type biogenesis protein CcmH/NrfF
MTPRRPNGSPGTNFGFALILAVLTCVFLLAAPHASADASQQHPTLDEVSTRVNCPTCHRPLSQSNGPASERMRAYIRQHIAMGWTRSAIIDGLVAEYDDESVRAAPKASGIGALAWAAPLAACALLVAFGWYYVRKWASFGTQSAQSALDRSPSS